MKITVPTAPQGVHPAAARRLVLTGVDTTQQGGFATRGHQLHQGDTVDLPAGSLILCVDKTTLRTEVHHETQESYRVEDAAVSVHLVTAGGLRQLWQRRFKNAKSAYGPAALTKMAALLAAHPAPEAAEPAVVEQVRRPNLAEARCRWCAASLPPRTGHVVAKDQVEHWQECPTRQAEGGPCARCGEHVEPGAGNIAVVREGAGWLESRHRECEPVPGLPVLRAPLHRGRSTEPGERRTPNARAVPCHWCGDTVAPQQGWLAGWHENARYEHERCPGALMPAGQECALCGVDMCIGEGWMAPHRQDGHGGRRPEHLPSVLCTVVPARSAAAVKARREAALAAERERFEAAKAKAAAEEERKKARRAAARRRKEEKAAAELAEDRRLSAGAAVTSRTSTLLQSKQLGNGRTALLREHTLVLDNGHTTKRWQVEVEATATGWTGEDYDPDHGEVLAETDVKSVAQEQYRDYRWEPAPRVHVVTREEMGASSPCPPGRHCGHCASPIEEGQAMMASLGLACGNDDCYTVMSDERGAHDRRYHRR